VPFFAATAIFKQPFCRIDMTLLPNLHCSTLKLSANPGPQKKSTCLTIPIYKKKEFCHFSREAADPFVVLSIIAPH
jgi:hypothetical protein